MPEKETDYLKINVLLHLLSIDWMVEKQRKMYCSPPPTPQPPQTNKQNKKNKQTDKQEKKRYSQHDNDQEHKLELFI